MCLNDKINERDFLKLSREDENEGEGKLPSVILQYSTSNCRRTQVFPKVSMYRLLF